MAKVYVPAAQVTRPGGPFVDRAVDLPELIWYRPVGSNGRFPPAPWWKARVLRSPAPGLVTLRNIGAEDDAFAPTEVTYSLEDISWQAAYGEAAS
jgi:hypothetical protein